MPAYKDEKRKTWYVRFRYTDWTGKRIETTKRGFATKRDAQRYEEEARREKTAAAGLTYGELYKLYMEDMKPRLKQTSLRVKEDVNRKHIAPYFETMPLDKITPAAIRQWQTKILALGYAPTYTRMIQNQLSACLNYAVKYYGLARNPAKIAGSIGKMDAGEMDFWTLTEFEQFIAAETKPMYRAAFLLLFWCGLRFGEMLALTGEDVDAKAKTIRINKTLTRLKGKDVITPPKTEGSIRTISAPSVVFDAIADYTKRRYKIDAKERIFPLGADAYRDRLARLCALSGVKEIRMHDIRHSHASYLINNNVPVKLIAQRLGHSNIETTLKTYAHMYKDTSAAVAELIESDARKSVVKVRSDKK